MPFFAVPIVTGALTGARRLTTVDGKFGRGAKHATETTHSASNHVRVIRADNGANARERARQQARKLSAVAVVDRATTSFRAAQKEVGRVPFLPAHSPKLPHNVAPVLGRRRPARSVATLRRRVGRTSRSRHAHAFRHFRGAVPCIRAQRTRLAPAASTREHTSGDQISARQRDGSDSAQKRPRLNGAD